MSSRVASKLAVRASRRPSTSWTTLRATCVDSRRSVGVWNVPTFSAREWRSAALDVDGANGSWTWQTSSGRIVSRSSIVRETSTGSAGARRRAARQVGQRVADGEHARRRAGLGQQRAGIVARGAQRLARLAHRLAASATARRSATRCPRRGQLGGHALDVGRDRRASPPPHG